MQMPGWQFLMRQPHVPDSHSPSLRQHSPLFLPPHAVRKASRIAKSNRTAFCRILGMIIRHPPSTGLNRDEESTESKSNRGTRDTEARKPRRTRRGETRKKASRGFLDSQEWVWVQQGRALNKIAPRFRVCFGFCLRAPASAFLGWPRFTWSSIQRAPQSPGDRHAG